ncbi:MAG: TolC family protein [Bacteroidota bacterium]|nr:TolC family protein [Bacteroidota bacterium]
MKKANRAARYNGIAVLILIGCSILQAQNPVLEEYISEGLESNQGLKQKQLDYAVNLAALKEAKGLFFPDISFNARYTLAEGGRMIEFPVGDLLNPVYSTLNMLTGTSDFPQIENQTFPFYRPTEQETKLSLVQPIFNSDLIQNYHIKKQYTEIARVDLDRYKRELIKEISKAYYEYQKAHNLVALADTSLALVAENLRVSQRLFENDKVTVDAVYRSEAELSKVEVQRAQANNMLEASRAYFNFLLNRELATPVELLMETPVQPVISLEEASLSALQNRDELNQIKQYQQLNKHLTSLHRGKNIPGLFGVVDYGIQGDDYQMTTEDDFLLASLVMKWTLFQGTVNRQKVQQSRIEGDKLVELYSETQQQIRLEVINHYYGLQAAYESVQSAGKQTRSASKAYQLIDRKYAEGQSSLLELIDARTSLTNAAANSIIAQSEYFSSLADFEYAMGANGPEKY